MDYKLKISSLKRTYDQILLGEETKFSSYYFEKNRKHNQSLALEIIRYALQYYMNWTPEQIRDCTTISILKQLHLFALLKYIQFPPELNKKKDLYYISTLLFPYMIPIQENDLIIELYERHLKGQIQYFPKEYFDGAEGMHRACVCLHYALQNYMSFSNIQELYQKFSERKISVFLRKYHLMNICQSLFDTPIDFLHETLPKEQRDFFLYQYGKFTYLENKFRTSWKKKTT